MANVHSLLRAVIPLSQLTTGQAVDKVIEKLLSKTQSRKNQMKKLLRANKSS